MRTNPLTMAMMNATGDKGWFGWQDDKTIEALNKGLSLPPGVDIKIRVMAGA